MNTIILLSLVLLNPDGSARDVKNLAMVSSRPVCEHLRSLIDKDPERPAHMKAVCREVEAPKST